MVAAKVWIQRGLTEDEFKLVRGTPMWLEMLKNRLNLRIPNVHSTTPLYIECKNEVESWLHHNATDVYFFGRSNVGHLEIFFLSPNDAVNFRLTWSDREFDSV